MTSEQDWIRETIEEEYDRDYLVELSRLQVELLRLQQHLIESGLRLAVLFEGRDTAGKGGAILRFSQHMQPRHLRIVALPKPSERELAQWFFQRYVHHLPDAGEIALFDRSWYNRAVVEPVMGFCTTDQYERFMREVVGFERMLLDDGIVLVKLWFSIGRDEQQRRIRRRELNPLKRWKLSTVDRLAQEKWEAFTRYKMAMFERTSTPRSPWVVVRGDDKKRARLESIRYLLTAVEYPPGDTGELRLRPDSEVVSIVTPGSARSA